MNWEGSRRKGKLRRSPPLSMLEDCKVSVVGAVRQRMGKPKFFALNEFS